MSRHGKSKVLQTPDTTANPPTLLQVVVLLAALLMVPFFPTPLQASPPVDTVEGDATAKVEPTSTFTGWVSPNCPEYPKQIAYGSGPHLADDAHYIWIRAWACGGPDDTVFAGLDGVLTPGMEPVMTGWGGCTWQWKSQLRDGGRPSIDPARTDTNGSFHRFYLWMKEDGIRIDRIILTQDRCWMPTGAAPPPGC